MAKPHPSEIRFRKILSSRRKGEALCRLADRMKVNRRTLYWWHQRLAKQEREQAEESEAEDLVPVEVEVPGLSALGSMLAPTIEVALRESGHVLRIPARFEVDALRRLVDVLERG